MGAFCQPSLAQPCALRRSFCSLSFGLRLKKLSQNFCERYRYGSQRLAQRLGRQKSPHNLRAFTTENSRIPYYVILGLEMRISMEF
ncbi:hypothetical protein PTQ35_01730 [Campylobacter sp. 46490-21]|uniref:hypothetical protein n=1 Tax=Campylobacter magnus TaxID=3026462 RepID=UPI002361EE55|nr:hypothetical protein [Campylobacter magnus]MDD0847532.1 hypothetical protein [Campylobacter magnus]